MDVLKLTGAEPRWPEALRRQWIECVNSAASYFDRSTRDHPVGDLLKNFLGVDEQLFITNGVRATVVTLASLGRRVFVEQPTFMDIPRLFARHGCAVTAGSVGDLVRLAGDPATSLIWVTSPCRNPDGAALSPDIVGELGRFTTNGGVVVQNETYHWFSAREPVRIPGAILVGSFHKLAGSWARTGWLCGELPPDLRHDLPYQGPPAAWQSAWEYFLDGGGLDSLARIAVTATDCAARVRRILSSRQPLAVPLEGPTVHIWVPVPDPVAVLHDRYGIRVSPGTAFGAGTDTVRISFVGCDADLIEWERFHRMERELEARVVMP